MTQTEGNRELKSVSYELFILLLSLLSILNIIPLIVPGLDPVVKEVILLMNGFISAIFFADFLYRLLSAGSKRGYFLRKHGWADLLASLPFPYFKIFRVFRIIRVVRLMRELGEKELVREIKANRSSLALYVTAFLVILVLEFGGMGIVYVEADLPGANIKTAFDGVWWSFVSITTVGYGDRYPVSNAGRIVGMITMTIGVGLFGVLTGYLADTFLSLKRQRPEATVPDQRAGVAEIQALRQLLEEQERVNTALKSRLMEIEAALTGKS